MMRKLFYIISIVGLVAVALIAPLWDKVFYFLIFLIPYILIGLINISSTHNVLRNYPVIGLLRYAFEFVRPEIQQYFIATNQSGRPFNRETRDLVYQRANATRDTLPFGTQHDITDIGYESANHSLSPKEISESDSRIMVGGPDCKQPYCASRLNISAMSFGAISSHAVMAMNKGAQKGNFYQNTGEGGLSKYHLWGGGDIVWQLGTACFGARTQDGDFCPDEFKQKATLDAVKMIEVKLSQGAKPSHGGILPGVKVDKEIAEIRGIEPYKTCVSPPAHKSFSTPIGLIEFIAKLRDLCGGKPVGFKLCIGNRSEFMGICKAMIKTGITPDFITVDGAEGGTGAAPPEYSNSLGTSINDAVVFVHNCLVGSNLRDKIRIIASGKVATGFDIMSKLALGAEMCNVARPMMFAVGCIQALRCNANTCPTGVTTQDKTRIKSLVVEHKYLHVYNYHRLTVQSFLELTGAIGVAHPDELGPEHIFRRVSADKIKKSYAEIFHYLAPGSLLDGSCHETYSEHWEKAHTEKF